jgi:uncharacterized membrane protein YbaN (DUF454 family)
VETSSTIARERACPMARHAASVPAEPVGSRAKRLGLMVLGTFMLALGVVGIFLPVLPTTCFLLGAAACYGRSSSRFYRWMYTNRLFGNYLRTYRDERAMSRKIKYGSLTVLWVTIAISVAIMSDLLWVQLVLVAVAVAVTLHVASLKTLKGSQGRA